MLSVDDLRELGVPMGPRKKLAELISREKERVERVQVCVCVRACMCVWCNIHAIPLTFSEYVTPSGSRQLPRSRRRDNRGRK